MKRIALFGFYSHGNFGDDLMALQFARAIQDIHGTPPVIYGLSEKLAEAYGFESTSSITDLLHQADACFIGGGGILSNLKTCSSPEADAFSTELIRLNQLCQKRQIPIWAWSIGGNATGARRPLRYGATALLLNPMFQGGTVRLPEDIELFDYFGKPASYYPDIVLGIQPSSPRVLARPRRIGINISNRRVDRPLVQLLAWMRTLSGRPEYLFFHNSQQEQEAWLKWYPDAKNQMSVHHADPFEMCSALADLDLFIGHRLHLGIAALAAGVPFVGFNPLEKTHRFLKSLNLEDLSIHTRHRKLGTIFSMLRGGDRWKKGSASALSDEIVGARASSASHLKEIQTLLAPRQQVQNLQSA